MVANSVKNWRAGLRGPNRLLSVRALLLSGALLLLSAAAPARLVLREQAWTAPGAERARHMTQAPSECLARRDTQTEIGRALFRSPALLGGQAARAGLSCHACHSNGRVNAHFLLPELTDRPGAADVTSEWASHTRGDGVANPIDIPELNDVTLRNAFGQARDPSLEHFVRGVIVEEFQGQAPPTQAFDGVIAYLGALRTDACSATDTPIDLTSASDDVRRALTAAESADRETARLLVLAAQDSMGRIAERLPVRRFASDRSRIERLARELGAMRNAEDVHTTLEAALPGWRARFDAAISRLGRREQATYFNEATLRRALER